MKLGKGGYAAPLLFLSLAVAAIASRHGNVTPAMAAIVLLALTAICASGARIAFTPLAVAVAAYGGIIAVHTLALSPAYTAAGLLHPLLLVAGFVAGRRMAFDLRGNGTLALCAYLVALAIWGLVQIGPLGLGRAYAVFETPATYGATINFALIGVFALLLAKGGSYWLIAVAVLWAAASFAAESRGAWLALAIGFATAVLLSHRVQPLRWHRIGLLIAIVAAGWLFALAVRMAPWPDALAVERAQSPPTEAARIDSTQSRLELYAASWKAWRTQPLSGTGYLTFRYVLEQSRAEIPSYGVASETWAVHNDYLQSLQEVGPAGALALLAVVSLPLLLCYRRSPSLSEEDRVAAVATSAAIAGMAAHAMVDFPFHVPVTLVLYGVFLGTLDRLLFPGHEDARARAPEPPPWLRAARAALLTVVVLAAFRPLVAEAAAEWGMRRFQQGDAQSAALWLGIARRVEPADWRYHWYAGQFWDAQASVSRKPEAARLAVEAFDTGLRANPFEVRNLLGTISAHRRYRDLLEPNAQAADFRAWLQLAARLAPLDPAVARERARVLEFLAQNSSGTEQ